MSSLCPWLFYKVQGSTICLGISNTFKSEQQSPQFTLLSPLHPAPRLQKGSSCKIPGYQSDSHSFCLLNEPVRLYIAAVLKWHLISHRQQRGPRWPPNGDEHLRQSCAGFCHRRVASCRLSLQLHGRSARSVSINHPVSNGMLPSRMRPITEGAAVSAVGEAALIA